MRNNAQANRNVSFQYIVVAPPLEKEGQLN